MKPSGCAAAVAAVAVAIVPRVAIRWIPIRGGGRKKSTTGEFLPMNGRDPRGTQISNRSTRKMDNEASIRRRFHCGSLRALDHSNRRLAFAIESEGKLRVIRLLEE